MACRRLVIGLWSHVAFPFISDCSRSFSGRMASISGSYHYLCVTTTSVGGGGRILAMFGPRRLDRCK